MTEAIEKKKPGRPKKIQMPSKVCSICEVEKDASDFRPHRTHCKKCASVITLKWRLKNREKVVQHRKNYYQRHKEKYKDYAQKNKAEISERMKEYRKANKEKIKESTNRWREANIKSYSDWRKGYHEKYYKTKRDYLKEKSIRLGRANTENLSTVYLKARLMSKGFDKKQIKNYPELIELQKTIIQIKRSTNGKPKTNNCDKRKVA